MEIPLIDLQKCYLQVGQKIEDGVIEILQSGQYISGEYVDKFEQDFADYIGVKYAISVGNGTDALTIGLKALGIGSGDEVITTPFTFFATAESISASGATPVFVDIDLESYNIDATHIEARITPNTKAIMPVHIFGQCADMEIITELADKYGLYVIEDACQAVGATYQDKKAGALGDLGCFSFFPTKNLGCAGDGGMIVTDDEQLAILCRALSKHGSGEIGRRAYEVLRGEWVDTFIDQCSDHEVYKRAKYYNYLVGCNSRLDEIQAYILQTKLPYLDKLNKRRRDIANIYQQCLKDTSLILPKGKEVGLHVYHLYIIQSEQRQLLIDYLKKRGVATGVYYPVPLHLQWAYDYLGYQKGDLPVAEYLAERTLAIPIYPELEDEQVEYIVQSIKSFYQ